MPFFLFSIWGIVTGFRNSALRRIALIHLGSLAMYVGVSGQGNTARFLFVIFGTGAGLCVVGLADIMRRMAARKIKDKYLIAGIWAVVLITIVLSAMTVYVLSRPTDLAQKTR